MNTDSSLVEEVTTKAESDSVQEPLAETIPLEEYPYRTLLGSVAKQLHGLGLREDGVRLKDECMKHVNPYTVLQAARNLIKNNLMVKVRLAAYDTLYFSSRALLDAYMARNALKPWDRSNKKNNKQLMKEERDRIKSQALFAADQERKEAKAEVFRFSKNATVDMSKAKVTVIPPPALPIFTTTYNPNEKQANLRYSRNLVLDEEDKGITHETVPRTWS